MSQLAENAVKSAMMAIILSQTYSSALAARRSPALKTALSQRRTDRRGPTDAEQDRAIGQVLRGPAVRRSGLHRLHGMSVGRDTFNRLAM